ncbi:MAG TPA: type IV pilus twitching motility protein PilT [bacterium]|nr:type IV pilus twitching motility protein PilT [Myxococcales bacterium]OQA61901.1 MAG: Twitching mobility protein [bacterium ADurb.Bin270]HPW45597.1 type IV pilus twitching motility protein PilT [bacterium]HQG13632.1 type IV pilus twitching motility protein PilT [bacterium]
MTLTLRDLLIHTIEKKGSDLHINTGLPPQVRIDGKLTPIGDSPLSPEQAKELCYECLNQEQVMHFETERSIDLSFQIEGHSRFRANIFWALDTVCAAFRPIPLQIPTPDTLGIPASVLNLINKPRGLVLVTGQTGSGKSTTLASMLEQINQNSHEHIITIEDPIEYLFTQKKSLINQREIGRDAHGFSQALRYILRQDPDVVLIGEMRDLETIQSAITVAETGHLVFATLHTNSAVQSVDRIIDVFPPHHQNQVRTQLSFMLEGVVSQQLLPKIGGGRTLAMEILLPNSGIRNLIREGKTHQIAAQMQMGQQHSDMVMMDQSLAKLVKAGIVDHDEARRAAINVEDFNSYML